MRRIFFLLLLPLAAAHAQTTDFERSLYERIMKPDKAKTFDPRAAATIGARSFSAKSTTGKEFHFEQRFTPAEFRSKEFTGAKSAAAGDFKFATKEARTRGNYEIPNATKAADTKTAPTKDARDANKTAATRELPGANRTYLGPEAAKVKQVLDPMNLPRVTNDLRELKTIEDIRELLNKNK